MAERVFLEHAQPWKDGERRVVDSVHILSQGEYETAEFKDSFNDEALETIGSFAYAAEGMPLIGVEPAEVVKRLMEHEP